MLLRWLFLTLSIAVVSGGWAQLIVVDEVFDEWLPSQVVYTDLQGDGSAVGLDFGRLWISDDTRNIYFRIELGSQIELQEYEELAVYIDVDNNINTGANVDGESFGVDFVYRFGQRNGTVYINGQSQTIFHSDFNLVSLPTVSSSEFEISFLKTIDYFFGDLNLSNTINVVFRDNKFGGDRLPQQLVVSYIMAQNAFAPPSYSIEKIQTTDLRITSYNALNDGLFESNRQSSFQRLLRAIVPDVICFQEVYDHSSAQVAGLMEVFLPSSGNELWYHSAVNPDIILISRYPIISTASSDGNGIFKIDVDGQDIIIVGAHLPCCNNEEGRQLEIDKLLGFVRNSIDGFTNIEIVENTPLFIIGDMNLVGDRQQQLSLATGDIIFENLFGPDFNPDWDGTMLEDALPIATGRSQAVTWYNPNGSFSAGRLDYLLYSGSVVDVRNSYSLNTHDLTVNELSDFNLQAMDTERASDHFPCVMDVDLSPNSAIGDQQMQTQGFFLYPNPVHEFVFLDNLAVFNEIIEINIFSTSGELIFTLKDGINSFPIKIDMASEYPGVFIIRLTTEDQVVNFKILNL